MAGKPRRAPLGKESNESYTHLSQHLRSRVALPHDLLDRPLHRLKSTTPRPTRLAHLDVLSLSDRLDSQRLSQLVHHRIGNDSADLLH